jgi:choline dehydrogenase-like flavoprotein
MENTFDAIVIGSGISGGWAAKELCDKGLKTLVLERGRNIEHIKDYPTANLDPWKFRHRGMMTRKQREETSLSGGGHEDNHFFYIKDHDHPYVQEKPFRWRRGYQVGGRSLTWGNACQRWSEFEFTAPGRFGYGLEWPIGYKDIAPWYSHVERFAGICGNRDGLEAMPDGEFLPPFDLNYVEKVLQERISENYKDRHMVQGRFSFLTRPEAIHLEQGRGRCMARNLCGRGCFFGAYFSSVSSTLPWARKTGNMTLRPFSVVHSIIYDDKLGKASGVRVIDTNTKEAFEYFARIIFVNASALNSNLILLNSISDRFPDGLGNDNGLLGKYICHHNYRGQIYAEMEGYEDTYYYGRNPSEAILVNYRNLHHQDTDYVGGFTTFMGAYRSLLVPATELEIGGAYKDSLTEPGPWQVYMYMQGETIPKVTNHVRLSKERKDQWGVPLLVISVEYDDNDEKMLKDFLTQGAEMLEAAGCRNIEQYDTQSPPGSEIHEMGGVRMGFDPQTSMLNEWNQLHLCKNVFVTDGACMTSTGNQSPSFLYMALTARAVDHAVAEMKRGLL